MEQQFQLKFHGNYTLFEQDELTAEERAWIMKRLDKELKDRHEREKQQMGNVPRPSRPSVSRPSMPRRR